MTKIYLGHGAAGNAASMAPWVDGLRARGFDAHAVDLPRRRAEDAVAAFEAQVPDEPGIVIGGHSYGGRVASLAVAGGNRRYGALVCLSYPLHRPGAPETAAARTAHWPQIAVPALLLSGTSDPFARNDMLRAALPGLAAGTLVEYPKLGHSLKPVLDDALDRIAAFLGALDVAAPDVAVRDVAVRDEATLNEAPARCGWSEGPDPLYRAYHDREWGVPVRDERHLFELLILEGAQAGLSWSTILHKREGYRRAFAGFDPAVVAAFDASDVARLLDDPGIVRNRAKVAAAIDNARATVALRAAGTSLTALLWSFVGDRPAVNAFTGPAEIPAQTDVSRAMSRELRTRGFKFVGPTICYALMQSAGLVNDHETRCFRWPEVQVRGEG
jgi:DNA-3-methyladenine glycosylase I